MVLNLTDKKPFFIEVLSDVDQFKHPMYFSFTGFRYDTKYQTWQVNSDSTLGFKRPFFDSNSAGLYRPFCEVDLFQLIKLKDQVIQANKEKFSLKRADIGDIELLAVCSVYGDESFFSLFAEQGVIYEVFFDQIKRMQDARGGEKVLLSPDELELFKRRLSYVLTRPTPVQSQDTHERDDEEVCCMSILKQVVLFNDQPSRVAMYRLADLVNLDITDYISCTADLSQVMEQLPSAQYFKMFDKFQQNIFTMSITEAVMPKRGPLKTFCAQSAVVSDDHEGFGKHREIKDDQALRSVQVRVIPLNWVYVSGGSLSTLFRQFGSQ